MARCGLLLIGVWLLAACSRSGGVDVGLGVADTWGGPALREFAARQSARVDTVPIARADPTQVDVLWVRELDGLLEPLRRGQLAPIGAEDGGRIAAMIGPDRRWIGLSGVVRVLVYDPERMADNVAPTHLLQLADPTLARQLVLADPARGRASWTAAALVERIGEARALEFYRAVLAGGAQVVDDEDAVLAALLDGRAPLALMDSDLAFAAQERTPRLVITVPDQDEGGLGALLLPIALALTAHGSGNGTARALVEYLLSPPVTLRLTISANQVLVLQRSNAPGGLLRADDLRLMPVGYDTIAEHLPRVRAALAALAHRT